MPTKKSPKSAIAEALDQQLEKSYTAKDRSNLKLPKTQVCDSCGQDLEHADYDLKKKNRFTAHLPDELETTCRACKKVTKKVTKGLFIKTLSQGSLLLSDTAIEWLNQPIGTQTPIPITTNKQMVIDALGMSIRQGDLEAIKILISLVQGKSASFKMTDPKLGEPIEQIEAEELPSLPQPTKPLKDVLVRGRGADVDRGVGDELVKDGGDDAQALSAPSVGHLSCPPVPAKSVEEQPATDGGNRDANDVLKSRRRSHEPVSLPLTSPLLDRLIGSS